MEYKTTDIYLFEVTKNNFHYSKSLGESIYFLKQFKATNSNPKLWKKAMTKFFWYRILQFWRNKSWKRFQPQETPYAQYLQKNGNILLFTHELSLSGAPRALLTLASVLKQCGKNPIIISPMQGEMREEATQMGITTIVDPLLEFKLCKKDNNLFSFLKKCEVLFFNTLDNLHFCLYTQDIKTRKIGWIHEGISSYINKFIHVNEKALSTLEEIYVVGEYAKAFAVEHAPLGKSIKTLLYGCEDIPTPSFPTPPHEAKVKILMIGTVDQRKGMHLLNQAVECLPEVVRQKIKITVVGKPICKSIAKDLANSKYECLKYIGQKTHEEVISLFKECDILLCPSLDDPMPIVCTEAMILKKVIIVSDHTGTASFIKNNDNGFVIPAGSPQAIADAIQTSLTRRETFDRIGQEARMIYEQNFTMEVFKKNVEQIFR